MQMTKLQGYARQIGGSREAERLRREAKVPAVVYGHGETPQHVAVDTEALENVLGQGSHVIELGFEGQTQGVLIKDVQFDPLGLKPTHVDFLRVDMNERIRVSVALEFRGTPAGVNEGGIFEEHLADLEVQALATQIPEGIKVNVNGLQLGDFLHVSDLELPDGVTAVTPGETLVCTVRAKVAEEVVEEPEEGAEAGPEIITAKAQEEGEKKD